MSKRLFSILAVFLLAASVFMVNAQDSTPLAYGDRVEGEITNDAFEVSYAFKGSEGDVVVVEMRRANTDSGLYNAALLLIGPGGDTLADSTDYYGFEGADALVVAQLPEAGEYTILATRDNGRTGDEEGEYTLRLLQPEILSDSPTTGSLTMDTNDQYYIVQPEGSFNVSYTMLETNYGPLVQVSSIHEDGYPESAAALSGVRLDRGTVGVFAEAGELFLVAIVADDLDYFFMDEINISYEVSASPAE